MEPKRILDPKFPYTKSSDIYSYGVLMWEISSGYPPFKDIIRNNNMISLAIDINNGVREVTIPDTPKDYEELYKKCWNQEPEQRPTIKQVLEEFSKMDETRIIDVKKKNENNSVSELQIVDSSEITQLTNADLSSMSIILIFFDFI